MVVVVVNQVGRKGIVSKISLFLGRGDITPTPSTYSS